MSLTLSGISGITSPGGDSSAGNNTVAGNQTISGNLSFNSGYGSAATAYGCRAWVNFNGTGTVAIRASGNVSSITDNGTGQYTVNFATSMPDDNYSLVATSLINRITGTRARGTTTSAEVGFYNPTTGTYNSDSDNMNVAVFR